MRQVHTTSLAVHPGAEQQHGDPRKGGQGASHHAHRNDARKSVRGLRMVPAPGGVAFVEVKPTS